MLKSTDKRTSAPEKGASYEETSQPSLGITFRRRDGFQRFAPYSFLSAVDFESGEMIFRFTTWTAIVRGERLEPIWKALKEACLSQVQEINQPTSSTEPWVLDLGFAAIDEARPLAGPAFASKREQLLPS